MNLENFGWVNDRLVRCAQPDAQGFAELRRFGFLFVVKLNTDDEFPIADETAAMGHHGNVVTFASVDPFVPSAQTVSDIVRAIAARLEERPDRKIAIHCTHGRDRTGLICAGYRILIDGWSLDEAWRELEHFNRTPDRFYRVCLEYVAHLRNAA